jgi:hypothetical protein
MMVSDLTPVPEANATDTAASNTDHAAAQSSATSSDVGATSASAVDAPPRECSNHDRKKSSKGARELPEELRGSEEAAALWVAARRAGFDCREQSVHGWLVKWRPRASAVGEGKGKIGDMYIFPPRDSFSAGIGSVRSLSNLRDALLKRKAAREDPASVPWIPPAVGAQVEVLLAGSAGSDANGGALSAEAVWRQARVLSVSPDCSFEVAVHDELGHADDDSGKRQCDRFNEST